MFKINQILPVQARLWKALKPKTDESLLLLQKALNQGANPNGVNLKGMSPLIACVQSTKHDRKEMLEALLKAGADATVQYKGRTALSYLLESSWGYSSSILLESLSLLIQHGADPKIGGIQGNALSDSVYIGHQIGREDEVNLGIWIRNSFLTKPVKYLRLVSPMSWDPTLISQWIDFGVDPFKTPLFFQILDDNKKMQRIPLKESVAQGIMSLALITAGRYEYRDKIENAFNNCKELASDGTLAHWMIMAHDVEAFRVTLTWMDLHDELYDSLQSTILTKFNSNNFKPLLETFLAYLEQEKLQKNLKKTTNTTQIPSKKRRHL